MLLSGRRIEVKSDWTEEKVLRSLASGDVNGRDDKGIPPLAFASYEAHCAATTEERKHWLRIANQLLDAGAEPLAELPDLLREPAQRGTYSLWIYKSLTQKSDHEIGDDSRSIFSPHSQYLVPQPFEQGWILCDLLRHGDETLSRKLLSKIDDKQYARLLTAALYDRDHTEYVQALSLDKRFDNTLDRIAPKLITNRLATLSEYGEGKLAQRFIRPEVSLDYLPGANVGAMHWACAHEDMELVDALLKAGANPNVSDRGITPFSMALGATSDPKFLRALVNKGFRIAPEEMHLTDAEKRDLATYGYHSMAYKGDGVPVAVKGKAGIYNNPSVFDTLIEMHGKLIIPAMIHEFEKTPVGKEALGTRTNFVSSRFEGPQVYAKLLELMMKPRNTPLDANHNLAAEECMIDFMQLHHTQNHPAIVYPISSFEKSFDFKWQPLTAKSYSPQKAGSEWSVECLTSSPELRAESDALGHCVGKAGYDLKCSLSQGESQPHIFSIRRNGVPVSTFEITLCEANQHTTEKMSSVVGNERVRVMQHRGLNDKKPSAEAQRMLQLWLEDVAKGLIPLNDKRGILEQNAKEYEEALAEFLKDKSYKKQFYESAAARGIRLSTMQDAEAAFEDAMRDTRRASERVGRDRRLIYTDSEPGDKRGKYHLIDGIHFENGSAVSYRDMSYQEWLRASGITEQVIRETIRSNYPKVAESLKQIWQQEDAVPIIGACSGRDRTGWRHYLNERSEQLMQVEDRQLQRSLRFVSSASEHFRR